MFFFLHSIISDVYIYKTDKSEREKKGVVSPIAPGGKEGLIETEQCVHLSSHMPTSHHPEGFRSSLST